MVKNEQNLHLKHPHGELAVGGVVKKFTFKKGVSLNMARKTKSDTLTYQRGNVIRDEAKEVDVHDSK